jgi:DNA-binding beta-propeller fold protein YncE
VTVLQAGERSYEPVEGWGKLPEEWIWGHVADVAVDSEGNVHVFTRAEHPYLVFDRSGQLLDHWGNGIFEEAHGMFITPDDAVYLVDRAAQTVLKFDKAGRHRLTLGTRHHPSDTGYVKPEQQVGPYLGGPMMNGVAYGGAPFNVPTGAAVAPDGRIFVSDGYRNARVHAFDADGTLIKSWGEPGHAQYLRDTTDGPGLFHTPHNIAVDAERVYVADRQNNRIQVFDHDGGHIVTWTGFRRPSDLHIEPSERLIYVSEMHEQISMIDMDGALVARITVERGSEPGQFWGPHGIAVDPEGSLYVAEIHGARLQKLVRRS